MPHKAGSSLSQPYDATLQPPEFRRRHLPVLPQKAGIITRAHRDCRRLPVRLDRDGHHRILICADKFQTGYDEPLLHTMYVDKHLSG